MIYVSIVLTIVFVFILRKSIHNRFLASVAGFFVFVSLFMLGFYYVADSMTGQGINEAVVYHLLMDMSGAGYGEFTSTIILSVLFLIASILFAIYTYKSIRGATNRKHKALRYGLAIAVMAVAYLINPAVSDLTILFESHAPQKRIITKPNEYLVPDFAEIDLNGKNLVYLYLESVERTYLDESLFPGLTPNLQKLEAMGISFSNLSQTYGTGWTIAGVVGSQCGIPLVANAGNSMSGVEQFLPEAVCIGDILNEKGYDLSFLGGAELDFAGKRQFYNSHGFQKVEGLSELLKYRGVDRKYVSGWGLYDDTLFDLLIKRYKKLVKRNKPFALFALTLDTHHPAGHVSSHCESVNYGDGSNPMLNSVYCLDRMVGRLVDDLLKVNGLKDTILVIGSDHLAMKNTASDLLEQGERQNLLLILGDDVPSIAIQKPGNTIDIAPTLLSLLGGTHQGLGFGRNLLSENIPIREDPKEFNEFLRSQTAFLNNLWAFPQLDKGVTAKGKKREIVLQDRSVKFPSLLFLDDKLEVKNIAFEFDFIDELSTDISMVGSNVNYMWIDECEKTQIFNTLDDEFLDDDWCVVIGKPGHQKMTLNSFNDNTVYIDFDSIETSFNDVVELEISEEAQLVIVERLETFQKYRAFKLMEITLPIDGEYSFLTNGGTKYESFFQNHQDNVEILIDRGVTLIGISDNNFVKKLKYLDTCDYDAFIKLSDDYLFQDVISKNSESYDVFLILIHDSAICHSDTDLKEIFKNTNLKDWKKIGYRTPYFAVISTNGEIFEHVGKREASLSAIVKSSELQ